MFNNVKSCDVVKHQTGILFDERLNRLATDPIQSALLRTFDAYRIEIDPPSLVPSSNGLFQKVAGATSHIEYPARLLICKSVPKELKSGVFLCRITACMDGFVERHAFVCVVFRVATDPWVPILDVTLQTVKQRVLLTSIIVRFDTGSTVSAAYRARPIRVPW
ncbi:MAG: hypothetical protein SGI86_11090 [Deltaproteobacteria bacterium]|nr:hypothetical protein [Deltaproteobacteria bacterium]